MPRPARRKSNSAASRGTSKRRLTLEAEVTPQQSKRSKRLSGGGGGGNSTPTKSQYFKKKADFSESDEDDEDEEEETEGGDASDFELETQSSPEPEEENENYDSEEEEAPRSAKRGRPKTKTPAKSRPSNGLEADEESYKPGSKLAPGTRLVIQKPKARQAGNVPYTDETIHPNTMLFLADLYKNNERQWLKAHDPDYRQSLVDFNAFVECLTQKVTEADETIPELPVKDIVFRIYRDVRFTSDPTPYKPYFSAAWSRTGRKGPYSHYYVQVQPGNKSFVGGGLWQPEAPSLATLRRDIDRKPHKIKRVLMDAGIRKELLGGVGDDEEAAVKAFVSHNAESALKTKPKASHFI